MLAIAAKKNGQILSTRAAKQAFDVPESILRALKGSQSTYNTAPDSMKLTFYRRIYAIESPSLRQKDQVFPQPQKYGIAILAPRACLRLAISAR